MPLDNGDEDSVLTPANVSVASADPEVLSKAPPEILESPAATDEASDELSDERAESDDPLAGETLPVFDERYKQEFEGLLYLGKLTRDFDYFGHHFVIKTLTVDEVLEVTLLSQPYVGSMGEMKAYQAAVVAACVTRVDGRPIALPLTSEPDDTPLRNRFDYIRRNWFMPTLDHIYNQYLLLEVVVARVLAALGEASG